MYSENNRNIERVFEYLLFIVRTWWIGGGDSCCLYGELGLENFVFVCCHPKNYKL